MINLRVCVGCVAVLVVLAGCAAKVESTFVAPTDRTVVSRLEPGGDGRTHIVVYNNSSVAVVVNGVTLSGCANVKNRCELIRLRVPIKPGQRRSVLIVSRNRAEQGHAFRYSWSWESEATQLPIVTGP
jgi:hypothetical protein